MSSIQEARVRTTPFRHAFRPRFPATPEPRLSATSFSHAFRPCLPTCQSSRGRCVTPKRPKTLRSRKFFSLLRPLKLRMKVGKVLGYTQLHCAVAFLADFRTHTLPDFCDTSRLTSSIRQARVRTTPFSHAFRPRFPATPKPRHSATSFSHAFRPCLPGHA